MTNITSITSSMTHAAVGDDGLVSMSDRFNAALAEGYLWAGRERDDILATASDPGVAADPQRLFELQQRQEAYTKQIALSSALVSHATKGIETLVKS